MSSSPRPESRGWFLPPATRSSPSLGFLTCQRRVHGGGCPEVSRVPRVPEVLSKPTERRWALGALEAQAWARGRLQKRELLFLQTVRIPRRACLLRGGHTSHPGHPVPLNPSAAREASSAPQLLAARVQRATVGEHSRPAVTPLSPSPPPLLVCLSGQAAHPLRAPPSKVLGPWVALGTRPLWASLPHPQKGLHNGPTSQAGCEALGRPSGLTCG